MKNVIYDNLNIDLKIPGPGHYNPINKMIDMGATSKFTFGAKH